jgi:hypothetical protein
MGAVFRPKDLSGTWRKIVQESIKDLSSDTKDSVLRVIDSWEGTISEEKLKELLGHDKAERMMKNITRTAKSKNKAALISDQQNQVNDVFRESLTFD